MRVFAQTPPSNVIYPISASAARKPRVNIPFMPIAVTSWRVAGPCSESQSKSPSSSAAERIR